ncbi:hypothetical protein CDIK_1909 [Cucumispora dikerogammari]|nr:hypothetical protein CDIK_1909 [Cucumispora dikerogammari]
MLQPSGNIITIKLYLSIFFSCIFFYRNIDIEAKVHFLKNFNFRKPKLSAINNMLKSKKKMLKLNEKMLKLNEKMLKLNEKMLKLNDKMLKLNEKMLKLNEEMLKLNEKMLKLTEKWYKQLFFIFIKKI